MSFSSPPPICEALEPRRFMSAALLKVGVVGDSDSDEYAFADSDRRTAKNYVEQLADWRKVDFGKFTTTSRPSPRAAGYANDWAHSGHTSSDIISEGQVKG